MAGARHAVIETTSQALARGYAKMWRFDLGVFTNLSQDHLAVHGSWEHYLASKAQLFVHLGPGRTAVLNAFDPACVLIDKILPTDILRLWVGVASRGQPHHEPDLTASNVEVSSRGTRVSLQPSPLAEQLGSMLEIPLVGEVFAENALCAAAAAHGVVARKPFDKVFESVLRLPDVSKSCITTPLWSLILPIRPTLWCAPWTRLADSLPNEYSRCLALGANAIGTSENRWDALSDSGPIWPW